MLKNSRIVQCAKYTSLKDPEILLPRVVVVITAPILKRTAEEGTCSSSKPERSFLEFTRGQRKLKREVAERKEG